MLPFKYPVKEAKSELNFEDRNYFCFAFRLFRLQPTEVSTIQWVVWSIFISIRGASADRFSHFSKLYIVIFFLNIIRNLFVYSLQPIVHALQSCTHSSYAMEQQSDRDYI